MGFPMGTGHAPLNSHSALYYFSSLFFLSWAPHSYQPVLEISFEGVCFVNSRHPGPRRVWMGGSELQSLTPFPVPPLPPLPPVPPVPNPESLIFSNPFMIFIKYRCRAPP